MADVNKIRPILPVPSSVPKFGSGNCLFGTIGRSQTGSYYMWTNSGVVNLNDGQVSSKTSVDHLAVESLPQNYVIELSVNVRTQA